MRSRQVPPRLTFEQIAFFSFLASSAMARAAVSMTGCHLELGHTRSQRPYAKLQQAHVKAVLLVCVCVCVCVCVYARIVHTKRCIQSIVVLYLPHRPELFVLGLCTEQEQNASRRRVGACLCFEVLVETPFSRTRSCEMLTLFWLTLLKRGRKRRRDEENRVDHKLAQTGNI